MPSYPGMAVTGNRRFLNKLQLQVSLLSFPSAHELTAVESVSSRSICQQSAMSVLRPFRLARPRKQTIPDGTSFQMVRNLRLRTGRGQLEVKRGQGREQPSADP
jgi:hypothetical protein